MQDLNDFAWFVRVVDHGGFAAAGRALDIPKSKLSRRIAQLEEQLGVRLIHRTTRQFTVTEVGQTFYQHCKAMLIEAEAAQEAIAVLQAEPRGSVRLTCPVTLLHVHVGPMLARFMMRYPGIQIQLEATNRRVDLVAEASMWRFAFDPGLLTIAIWSCVYWPIAGTAWWLARRWWRPWVSPTRRMNSAAGRG